MARFSIHSNNERDHGTVSVEICAREFKRRVRKPRTLRAGVLERQEIRRVLPIVVSGTLHVLLLLVLGLWVIPALVQGTLVLRSGFFAGEDLDLEELTIAIESDLDASMEPHDSEYALDEGEVSGSDLEFLVDRDFLSSDLATVDTLDEEPIRSPMQPNLALENGTLRTATSVEGAVNGVMAAIEGELGKGDVFVVWLFDASHSLVDDRRRVAVRLESFFAGLDKASGSNESGQLINTVVSFGARMKEHVGPTESRARVTRIIEEMPVDPSGKENVFGAIERCATKYASAAKDAKLMIVAWTDESGDDAEKLEDVIQQCRSQRATVHVVGPSAVLGADTGLHVYTDPGSHLAYLLPVTRGPDTAVPERLRLGYWYRTRPRPSSADPDLPFRLASWYGGRDMKGISSGFSPFALTRLTLQTDGSYTVFDDARDRPPFQVEAMSDYLPDYRPVDEYLEGIQRHTLRQAVSNAVQATLGQVELGPPRLDLFGKRSEVPPFRMEFEYYTPAQFRGKVRSARRRLLGKAVRTSRIVEEALTHLSRDGDVERGLAYAYNEEDSPRWRAWYDLTRGRLLAVSVRLEEYRLACEALANPDFLRQSTNCIIFRPSPAMKSTSTFQRRAEEAEKLLMRCVRDNENTPWAYLAQRELDDGLGIEIRQRALRLVSPSPAAKLPNLPRF